MFILMAERASIHLQLFAFWRLLPARMVWGQNAKPFFSPSTSQNRVNRGKHGRSKSLLHLGPVRPPPFVRKLQGYIVYPPALHKSY